MHVKNCPSYEKGHARTAPKRHSENEWMLEVAINMYALLQLGSTGNPVRTLQTQLKAVMNLDASFPVDGQFGAKTQAAVKAFQQQHELQVDGMAGAVTCAELNRIYHQIQGQQPTLSTTGTVGSGTSAVPTGSQTQSTSGAPNQAESADLNILLQQLEQAIEAQVAAAQSKVQAAEQRTSELQNALNQALRILEGVLRS